MTPSLGRGISLRRVFLSELANRLSEGDPRITSALDWVELVPENYIERGGSVRRALLQICESLPVAFHSTCFSVGSTDPIDWNFLGKVRTLAKDLGARWITDHLCYSSVNGVQLLDLLPLPFNEDAVCHVVDRIKQIQDFFEIPFGLENPSYYQTVPNAEMTEAEFLREIVTRSGCGLLLDVNNIYVNCFNHSNPSLQSPLEEAEKYMDTLPLDRLMEVHIAGHKKMQLAGETKLLDTHGAPVPPPVRLILQRLYQRTAVRTLLLEREQNVPSLDEVIGEVADLWHLVGNQVGNQVDPKSLSSLGTSRGVEENQLCPFN